jgi:lipid-A-disaccharide synthase
MKYYIIAGEASGDLHGSGLMRKLKGSDKRAEFRYMGGERMRGEGGECFRDYGETAYMGFVPVLVHMGVIMRRFREVCRDIAGYEADVVILIDYAGFNLKVAKWVKRKLGRVEVWYYIPPKVWAWKSWRVETIRRYVDRVWCIFPFEVGWYGKRGMGVEYVGNPSVRSVERWKGEEERERGSKELGREAFLRSNGLEARPIIAILPGSRRQEIKDNLGAMVGAAKRYSRHGVYGVVVGGVEGIEASYYARHGGGGVKVVYGQTYELLYYSVAALVTSGTATLEAGLLGVPQAVCYATPLGRLVRCIYSHCFGVRYISLVNILLGEELVRELWGDRFSEVGVAVELGRLLGDEGYRSRIEGGYERMRRLLGEG